MTSVPLSVYVLLATFASLCNATFWKPNHVHVRILMPDSVRKERQETFGLNHNSYIDQLSSNWFEGVPSELKDGTIQELVNIIGKTYSGSLKVGSQVGTGNLRIPSAPLVKVKLPGTSAVSWEDSLKSGNGAEKYSQETGLSRYAQFNGGNDHRFSGSVGSGFSPGERTGLGSGLVGRTTKQAFSNPRGEVGRLPGMLRAGFAGGYRITSVEGSEISGQDDRQIPNGFGGWAKPDSKLGPKGSSDLAEGTKNGATERPSAAESTGSNPLEVFRHRVKNKINTENAAAATTTQDSATFKAKGVNEFSNYQTSDSIQHSEAKEGDLYKLLYYSKDLINNKAVAIQ